LSIGAAACVKFFQKQFIFGLEVCLLALAVAVPMLAQTQPRTPSTTYIITNIQFQGNRRVHNDTLQSRIFSRKGDVYTEDGARRDFQALWNTQFFEDIRMEVEDDPAVPNGKILVFYVQERPVIRKIEYKGIKSISESDILDRFKDRKVGLTVENRFDPTVIKRAEVVLKELLAEHGHQFATVKPTYEKLAASNAVKLVFNIDEGPKVAVGVITIAGNHVFSSRKIIRAMRHSRPISIPLYITDIDLWNKTFDRNKLDEDLEVGVRGLYQDNGYFKVLVKDPILKTVDENKGGIPGPWPYVGSKHGKRTDITIPIEEGAQYRMGTLRFRSSDPDQGLFFKSEFLAKVFPVHQGDIFSATKLRKAFENYKKLYGQYGYIDFTTEPEFDVNDKSHLVNLTLVFDQQKQFVVRRIEFSGNTTTRDKVIRRELLLDEGSLFNDRLWELSLLRLNQLNYFETIKPENADLKKNVKNGTVDIRLKVKEKGKQSISFSGGVSGLAGSFVGLSYQTNNFLGLGETLTLSGQLGDRSRNATFGFTEPYLFDRPISTGFTVFTQRFDYNQAREESILLGQQIAINPAIAQNYDTDSHGFTMFASYPLRKLSFTRLGLTYGYSTTNISAFSQSSELLFESLQFTSLAGPSSLKGIRASKITPTLTHNTVNAQFNPTGGKSYSYAASFEGGPLLGNVNTVSNSFEVKYFHSTYHHRNVIGLRALTAFTTGYGGKVVPPFDRFYTGGEDTVRGFDYYTISPYVFIPSSTTTTVTFKNPTVLDGNGNPTTQALSVPILQYYATRPGGDSQTVFNAEYRIPIESHVVFKLFNDIGLNGIVRQSGLQLSESAVGLLSQQYPNPSFPDTIIPKNLELVPGTNFHPRDSLGVELVVMLPIIQAPFRVYYAYNPLRLTKTISAPRGAFDLTDQSQRYLQSIGVLNTQVIPELNTLLTNDIQKFPAGLVEAKTTFRFTINTTF
jgi:outer membrane protein insertion porin family